MNRDAIDARETQQELLARVEAMSRRMDHLQSQIDELQDEVSLLRTTTDTDRGSINYDAMSKSEKVREVRLAVLRRAEDRPNGKAAMTYREVMTFFDDHPSPGHCYDLMRDAGNLDGFEYNEREDAMNQIRVDRDSVNDTGLVHIANNGMVSGGA